MEKGSSGRKDNRKVWFGCLAGVCAVTLLLAAILCFAGPLPGMGNGSRGPEAGMNGMGTRTDEMQEGKMTRKAGAMGRTPWDMTLTAVVMGWKLGDIQEKME